MATERGNPEIARTFEIAGGYAEKKSDLGHAIHFQRLKQGLDDSHDTEGSRPDYVYTLGPVGGFIEAKAGDTCFPFSNLKPNQRAWLDAMSARGLRCHLWLWLGDRIGGKKNPRKAWLVDWVDWLLLEGQITERKSLSYLEACFRLPDWELEWLGQQRWGIPPRHPFWIVSQPLFLFNVVNVGSQKEPTVE